jgi:hypothetical protein
METNDGHDKFSRAADLVQAYTSLRPEAEKFTYYDERGRWLYALLSDINMQIVTLHDEVMKNVFTDIDYYRVVGLMPMWLRDAGHSQEGAMSRDFFEKLVGANNNYLVNKFLYYHDCEMLVNSLQNRFNTVEAMLSQVYDILTPVLKHKIQEYDEILFSINEISERVSAYINTIIIHLASSCDIMTKIAVELDGMSALDFSKYPKMLSANVTYGDSKKLPDSLKQEGTYFATNHPVAIVKVESIRNEIVHNGSLDFHAQLYNGIKDEVVENWVLMPAFKEDGNFDSFKGRKKFYDDPERTWNKELPTLVGEFLTTSQATLQLLLKQFSRAYYENEGDIKKYHKEIIGLPQSFMEVAKKEKEKK